MSRQLKFPTSRSAWRTVRSGAIALALVCVTSSIAQQEKPAPSIRVDVKLVLVEASVIDMTGRLITELKQEDFQVFDEGVEQKIEHFSRDAFPLEVVELTHMSGNSRDWKSAMLRAWSEVPKALDSRKDTFIGISGLRGVHVQVAAGDGKEAAESRELRGQNAAAEPSIEVALAGAGKFVRRGRQGTRRVVIFACDRLPAGRGKITREEMLDTLVGDEVTLYYVRIAPGAGDSPKKENRAEQRARESVEAAVQETGGRIFSVGSLEQLGPTMRSVIQTVKTRYTLGFYPGSRLNTTDRRLRKLEIKLQPTFGVKGRDYSVVAKRGYFPTTK